MGGLSTERVKLVAIAFIILLSGSFVLDAQAPKQEKADVLLKEIYKLNDIIKVLRAGIEDYEKEIRSCDQTISKTEKIISLAQQGNREAKATAREALEIAQEARKAFIERKNALEKNLMTAREFHQKAIKEYKKGSSGPDGLSARILPGPGERSF